MSRIGKKPVPVPDNVKVAVAGQSVTVESGKNKLSFNFKPQVTVKFDPAAKLVIVTRDGDSREAKALHGTTRAIIANMIEGVTKGFSRELDLVGVGWTVAVQGTKVVLNVGYANPRHVDIPAGVKVEVAGMKIKVSGPDAQAVGSVAAIIRSQRPPEPYNGKGIKYTDETIIRKQGKAFAGTATA
jgi:large subunit ribosomal protein L6